MSAGAHITSLEALETFRSSVIVYSNKVVSAIDQVTDEIRRTRGWVQQEQRRFWEAEAKRRDRALVQAKQELLGAKMVGMLQNFTAQQTAVRKARHALEEAETKLRNVKRWTRDFDSAVEPLTKSLESFRSVLGRELPRGISFLTQAQVTLAAYREVTSGRRSAASAPAGESPAPESP